MDRWLTCSRNRGMEFRNTYEREWFLIPRLGDSDKCAASYRPVHAAQARRDTSQDDAQAYGLLRPRC